MHLERQKYKDTTLQLALQSQQPYFQPKYDGIWCCAHVDSKGKTLYKSRNGQVKKEGMYPGLYPGFYVGELMYGSQWAQAEDRLGKFYLFDFLEHPYTEKTYGDRFTQLAHNLASPSSSKDWLRTQTIKKEHLEAYWEHYVTTDQMEGIVLRDMDSLWSDTLYRCKNSIEVDLVVTGIVEGKGKHAGSMGALITRRINSEGVSWGDDINVGGGYSDALRRIVWTQWPQIRGQIITVSAKKIFSSGSLRHPNFLRFHSDKEYKPE